MNEMNLAISNGAHHTSQPSNKSHQSHNIKTLKEIVDRQYTEVEASFNMKFQQLLDICNRLYEEIRTLQYQDITTTTIVSRLALIRHTATLLNKNLEKVLGDRDFIMQELYSFMSNMCHKLSKGCIQTGVYPSSAALRLFPHVLSMTLKADLQHSMTPPSASSFESSNTMLLQLIDETIITLYNSNQWPENIDNLYSVFTSAEAEARNRERARFWIKLLQTTHELYLRMIQYGHHHQLPQFENQMDRIGDICSRIYQFSPKTLYVIDQEGHKLAKNLAQLQNLYPSYDSSQISSTGTNMMDIDVILIQHIDFKAIPSTKFLLPNQPFFKLHSNPHLGQYTSISYRIKWILNSDGWMMLHDLKGWMKVHFIKGWLKCLPRFVKFQFHDVIGSMKLHDLTGWLKASSLHTTMCTIELL